MNTDKPSPQLSSLERFLSGINESIFHATLGIADIELVNYLNNLLMRFVRSDTVSGSGRPNGSPANQVFEMLIQAEQSRGVSRRRIHQSIGDFTLFWSGMYPESLNNSRVNRSPDGVLNYHGQGKRSYSIASEIEGGEGCPSSQLLKCLSDQFDLCAHGLREVRREWEERTDNGEFGLLA
ncbi:hypothetical protein OAL35_02170 [bacterium]|nr:hypothetical protein [bacterium]